jgi:transposase
MARIAKKTKRYRSDLTDEEWLEITPLMPNAGASGPSARGGVPRARLDVSEAMILVAMGGNLLRRTNHP